MAPLSVLPSRYSAATHHHCHPRYHQDLGAIVTDNQGHSLSYRTLVSAVLESRIVIDTSAPATDHPLRSNGHLGQHSYVHANRDRGGGEAFAHVVELVAG
jgi:hypothetical protein